MSKKASRVWAVLVALGLMVAVVSLFGLKKSAKAENKLPDLQSSSSAIAKYQYLSSLDGYGRKDFYATLAPEDKVALWKIHMGAYLAEHPGLKDEQQQVILKALSIINVKHLDGKASESTADNEVDPLQIQARAVFQKGEAGEIFASLGSKRLVIYGNELGKAYVPSTCGCNRSVKQDLCWNTCANTGCNGSQSGCGWWWSYACNGECT